MAGNIWFAVILVISLISTGCIQNSSSPIIPSQPSLSPNYQDIKTVTIDDHSLSFQIINISINSNPNKATNGNTIFVVVKNVGGTATSVICYSVFTDYGGIEDRSISGEPTGLLYPDDSRILRIRDGGFISHTNSQYNALKTHGSSLMLDCLDIRDNIRFEPKWSINPKDIFLES